MLPKIVATVSLAGLTALSLLLVLTSPNSIGPFGLLLVFVSAYLTFVGMISFFLYGIGRLINFVSRQSDHRRPRPAMSFRRSYYFSTVVALAPVLLIGLQSIRSIGIYEIILVVAFEIVACIYVSRRFQ